jgi:amidohydrolase
MVGDGLMDCWGIQEVYGMPNMPGIPICGFTICSGAIMAAADTIDIVVTGKGGHAAQPHDCIDTTLVAAHLIVALLSITSRGVDPMKQVVLSICAVETDSTAYNVIPQVVRLEGTVHTMNFAVQDYVERRVQEIAEGTAMAFGAKAQVNYQRAIL